MPVKQIDYNSEEYRQMVQLRYEILRKPLGLEFSAEELEEEANSILIGAFQEDQLLACCILTPESEKEVRLRQMAVSSASQGRGIGATLMNYAENISRDRGFSTICMHAREGAIGFYQRLGYRITGEPFVEVTLPHVKMEKSLGFRY